MGRKKSLQNKVMRRGRPTKKATHRNTFRCGTYLPEKMRLKVWAKAQMEGHDTVAAWLRALIKREVS